MGKHALLSASSSHRWLNCPPSARLCEQYEDKGSDYAAEGTDAHALCEYKVKAALGIAAPDPTAALTHYSEEMEECAAGYAAYILELVETAKQTCADPVVLIEQRLDFSRYVEGGFGTGDCVIISDGTLRIVDYKHGQGVLVEATDNPQMKLYALGALELFDGIYDIAEVSMTIYQPRRDNISTHTVFKESLYQWAEEVLRPTAEIAYAGKGEYQCGEWCQFCKAKHECRKRAEWNMELARYDFKRPPLLEDDEQVLVTAINDTLSGKDTFLTTLQNNIAAVLSQGNDKILSDIEKRLEELQTQLLKLASSKADYEDVADEIYRLREQKQKLQVDNANRDELKKRMADMSAFLREQPTAITQFDEPLVRRLIENVTVFEDKFTVEFKSGVTVDVKE